MRALLVLFIAIVFLGNVGAKVYYVSTSGSNTNSGLTSSLAWKTLAYAAGSSSPVVAGDTVYVKSGSYGAEKVVFQKSGIVAKPISFIGYKTAPGDAPPLLVNNANPYAAFSASDMPTYDGGNRASGTGFDCTKQKYLVIKNFQIQNYQYGFVAGSAAKDAGNLILYNVNAMFLGDLNSTYSGEGILLGSMGTSFSNNNTLENCLVVNAAAEDFGINGDNNTLLGCKAYCNENKTANSASDYYILVCGSYNSITNCYIERAAGLAHMGHGMGAKTNAEQVIDNKLNLPTIVSQYNTFSYCTAKNMGESFYVRHRNAQYNKFYHCKAIGTHTGASGSPEGEGNCIVTRDGASNNTFDGCIAENCAAGIVFEDTVEDGDTGTNPPGHPGNNNLYVNCLIYNCYMGVDFSDYSIQSDAGDNTIANCTFYKSRYLHYAARHCANMKYVGNIYYGCLPTTSGGYFSGSTYAKDIVPNGTNTYFKNCDFVNIEGGMPTNFVTNSTGSIAKDPLFNNASSLDFHLLSTSPCIDASVTVTNETTDYDNVSRPQGLTYDVGAFESPSLTAIISSTNVSCNGGNNGSAKVALNGGKAPYTYLWSNGQTNAVCSGLSAGNYSVTVSDATPSSQKYVVTITQPSALTNSVSSTVASCSHNNGTAASNPSGGTSAYTYLWYPGGQITKTVSGLGGGVYSVRITDSMGCANTTSFTVSSTLAPLITTSVTPATNCFTNNGTGTVSPSGVVANYTYLWANGQTTQTATGLAPGTYSVMVSDVNGCSASANISVVALGGPSVTITSPQNDVSCFGGNNGSVTVNASGGKMPYTYSWNNGQTTSTATALSAGVYSVIVSDQNACSYQISTNIVQPLPITNSISTTTNVSCFGGNNGSVALTMAGGKAPYVYSWNNGQTISVCTGLSAGTYSLTVSDINGCSKVFTSTITQPVAVSISNISIVNASSCSINDGSIKITPSGGIGNYTFTWNTSPVQSTNMVTGLSPGQYSVIISDANACSLATTATVTCSGITNVNGPLSNENTFLIYPNPTSGLVNIVVAEKDENLITIVDLAGKELYEERTILLKTEIDLKGIENGIYFLRIENSKFKKTVKIVLNK